MVNKNKTILSQYYLFLSSACHEVGRVMILPLNMYVLIILTPKMNA